MQSVKLKGVFSLNYQGSRKCEFRSFLDQDNQHQTLPKGIRAYITQLIKTSHL